MCGEACEVKLEQCVFSIYGSKPVFYQMTTFGVEGETKLLKAAFPSVRDEPLLHSRHAGE